MSEIICTRTITWALEGLKRILGIIFGKTDIECYTISCDYWFACALGVTDADTKRVTVSISGEFSAPKVYSARFHSMITLYRTRNDFVSGREWCQTVEIRGEDAGTYDPTRYLAKYDPDSQTFTIHEYGGRRIHWIGRSENERWIEPMFQGETDGLSYEI